MALGTVLTLLLAMGCGGGDDERPVTKACRPRLPRQRRPRSPPLPNDSTDSGPGRAGGDATIPVAAVAGGVAAGTEVSVVKTNPMFEDCVAVRALAGTHTGNPAAFRLCTSQNLRGMVDLYFAGVNAYDVDALLPLLEAGYRAEQESAIRQQLDELKAAGAQLTWTENQPPARTGPISRALLVTVEGGPSGTVRWQFGFIEVGEEGKGDWFINFVSAK